MTSAETVRRINDDVWEPFRRAYAALDADAFVALHTPDLIRAGGPTGEVVSFETMAAQTRESFADLASRGSTVAIEFRFLERLASDALASERGVFRIVATRADGDARTFFGKFHVFLRRTADGWRIAVDYDSDENGTIDASSFGAGAAPDEVDRFTA